LYLQTREALRRKQFFVASNQLCFVLQDTLWRLKSDNLQNVELRPRRRRRRIGRRLDCGQDEKACGAQLSFDNRERAEQS
jgi:hypothetical protein